MPAGSLETRLPEWEGPSAILALCDAVQEAEGGERTEADDDSTPRPSVPPIGEPVWGGRDRSLVAAQRFRDTVLLRVEPDTRVRRTTPRGSTNRTAIVGVTVEECVVRGKSYRYALAGWKDADVAAERRRFAVNRYGYERALAMATAARRKGVAQARAERLARQRREAAARLELAPPPPARVKDPLSRKGISMANRRPRRTA